MKSGGTHHLSLSDTIATMRDSDSDMSDESIELWKLTAAKMP